MEVSSSELLNSLSFQFTIIFGDWHGNRGIDFDSWELSDILLFANALILLTVNRRDPEDSTIFVRPFIETLYEVFRLSVYIGEIVYLRACRRRLRKLGWCCV